MSKVAELYNESLEEREVVVDRFNMMVEEYLEIEHAESEIKRERLWCKYAGVPCSFGICDECDVAERS